MKELIEEVIYGIIIVKKLITDDSKMYGLIFYIVIIVTLIIIVNVYSTSIEKEGEESFKIAERRQLETDKRGYRRYLEYLGEDLGEEDSE